jgi:hypothetical protein
MTTVWRGRGWLGFGWLMLSASLGAFQLLSGCGTLDPGAELPAAGGAPHEAGAAGAKAEPPDDAGAGGDRPSGEAGASAAAGVSGEGAGGTPDVPRPEGPLLPWAVGNTWTYRVTKGSAVTKKVVTIGDAEEVGGAGPSSAVLANHVTTTKGVAEGDHTESWQGPDAENSDRIIRYREQSFGATSGRLELDEYWSPPKLHIDGSPEHTVAGATWLEEYEETKLEVGQPASTAAVSERWTVVADDETLEVPAGVFEDTIHLRKQGDGSTKEYWYLRGVGKLKETGSQTEELIEYQLVEAPR